MDLRFYFAATKRCFAVFGITYNMLVNKHSDFLALGFFTGVDFIGTLGVTARQSDFLALGFLTGVDIIDAL